MSKRGGELIVLDEDVPDEVAGKYPEINLQELFSMDDTEPQYTYLSSKQVLLYTTINGKLTIDLEMDKGKILRLSVLKIERITKRNRPVQYNDNVLKNIKTIYHCKVEKWVDVNTDKPYAKA